MPSEDAETLRLRNGVTANVREALNEQLGLQRMLRHQPQQFALLLRLARGEVVEQSERESASFRESIRFLQQARALLSDEQVRPLTRDVLLSGYQQTPEGPVVAQPFDLTNDHQKLVADRVDREVEETFQRWVRDTLRDDDTDRTR